jgi:hypothetical protein
MIRSLVVAALAISAAPAADRSVAAEGWAGLQKVQAEELVAFALAIDAKEGSFDADSSAAALALAKKLDPSLKAKEPARKAMTPEDRDADKAARDGAAQRDVAREAAEKEAATKGDQQPGLSERWYPPPGNSRERFEALRFEMILDEADYLAALSANPEAHAEAALRQAGVKQLQELIEKPRWQGDKALKAWLATIGAEKYTPWSGVFTSRLGQMTLTQTGDKVAGFWKRDAKSDSPDGTFQGLIKDRTLAGVWKSGAEQGTFSFVLYRDDSYLRGWTKDKTDSSPVIGHRATDVPKAAP